MAKAEKISIENAKSDKLFYFVANVHIYRKSDGRFLLLKRSEQEKVFPGKWCTPGGKLEWGKLDLTQSDRTIDDVPSFLDPVEKLLHREVKEESGLEIEEKLTYLRSVMPIRPDGVPVILLIFIGTYKSGEVILEEGAFTDFAWVNADEVKTYDCIDSIRDEIAQATKLFK